MKYLVPKRTAAEFINDIQQIPQFQGATDEQVKLLLIAGNRLGLYDAVDFLRREYFKNKS